MKKIIVGVLSVVVVVISLVVIRNIFREEEKEEVKTPIIMVEEIGEASYYKLRDRRIYVHDLKTIFIGEEKEELREILEENPEYIYTLINQMELIDTLKDGGTRVYHLKKNGNLYLEDKKEDLIIYQCQTLEGNKDIHIGKKALLKEEVCQMRTNRVVGEVEEIKENKALIKLNKEIKGKRVVEVAKESLSIKDIVLIKYKENAQDFFIDQVLHFDINNLLNGSYQREVEKLLSIRIEGVITKPFIMSRRVDDVVHEYQVEDVREYYSYVYDGVWPNHTSRQKIMVKLDKSLEYLGVTNRGEKHAEAKVENNEIYLEGIEEGYYVLSVGYKGNTFYIIF